MGSPLRLWHPLACPLAVYQFRMQACRRAGGVRCQGNMLYLISLVTLHSSQGARSVTAPNGARHGALAWHVEDKQYGRRQPDVGAQCQVIAGRTPACDSPAPFLVD